MVGNIHTHLVIYNLDTYYYFRRISMMGIPKDDNIRKRRKIKITFNEEEDVINPEVSLHAFTENYMVQYNN